MSSPVQRPSRRPLARFARAPLALACACGLLAPLAWADPGPLADWPAANRRVGALLRGHLDVVQWENAQSAAQNATTPATPTPPASGPALTLDEALRLARHTRPDLVLPPGASAAERARLQQDTQHWVRTVRLAWLDAVTARAQQQALAPVLPATQAATELARRMGAAGNWSVTRVASEERTLLDVRAQWATTQSRARTTEARLRQLLPLPAPDAAPGQLPLELPPPPAAAAQSPEALVAQALAQHPAWQAAESHARQRDQTMNAQDRRALQARLNALHDAAGPNGLAERPLGTAWPHGGQDTAAARAAADALARQVQADVHIALDAWHTAHTLATTAAEAQAWSQQQLDDLQQRHNGMLVSTWELIAAARAHAQTAQTTAQHRHNAWRAHAELQAVLAGLPYRGDAPSADPSNAPAPKGH